MVYQLTRGPLWRGLILAAVVRVAGGDAVIAGAALLAQCAGEVSRISIKVSAVGRHSALAEENANV
jgi:hypothetical protein